jgi:phosphohistidine phosphatase SixA
MCILDFSGEAMKEKEVSVMHVYASPSLRCVETACSMLEGKSCMLSNSHMHTHARLHSYIRTADWYKVLATVNLEIKNPRDGIHTITCLNELSNSG